MTLRALEIEELTVNLGGQDVLRDLSFSVERGSFLAVIGPNGSGKTVLFKVLVGALSHQGVVRWADETRIGYVPQKLDIERDLPVTGRDFLRARVAVAGGSGDDLTQALEGVGLGAESVDIPLGALSGGQFQRLLLAFALVGRPNLLLLDEPMAGIDEPGQEKLNTLLHRLQQGGMTVMAISHDLSVVYQYATHVLCLSQSRVYCGVPRQILTPEMLKRGLWHGGSVSRAR